MTDRDKTNMAALPAAMTRDERLMLARRGALMLPLVALSGCSFFDNLFGDTKKKLPGTREDVLPVTEGLEPPHGMHPSVVLPAPIATDWPVEGGTPSHVAGNAALGDQLKQIWSTSIGNGNTYRRQITATPLVAGGTIFTIDSGATVSAFNAADGKRLWQTKTRPAKSRTTNIGGGIGFANSMLYASTGFSEVVSIDPANGKIGWRQEMQVPVRSAPTPGTGMIFVVTIDQELVGLSTKDGKLIWTYDGTPTDTTLLGQPAPAFANGYVVAGFGSGDLVAVRGDSGAVAWTDSIAASADQVGVARISAITAQPIIAGEVVVAIGTGGLMVGVDLRAGRRLWEREVSGIQPIVAAGGFAFITTSDQNVSAIRIATGEVAWLTTLPLYKRPKSKGAPLQWTGPVLAGGKLYYASNRNSLIALNALTGAVAHTSHLPDSVTVPPIAANNTLYILTDDGVLRAYA